MLVEHATCSASLILFLVPQPDVGWLTWGPVMDKYTRKRDYQFMADLPENLLKRGNIRFNPDFAYMSGVTRDEGSQTLCKIECIFEISLY